MPSPDLACCTLCPRGCGVNRLAGQLGFCRSGTGISVAAVCVHHGEEPAVCGTEGIANVFFTGCNLRCRYCQNHQISAAGTDCPGAFTDPAAVTETIAAILKTGARAVGFVSPAHVVPQVQALVGALRQQGHRPTFVYNTNAYELPVTLASLENDIDVYLPDFKYADGKLAHRLSGAADYPPTALAAIKEMVRQKGTRLLRGDDGRAYFGVIVRHLVLPGQVSNSIAVLHTIARHIGTDIHISLMSQYYPTHRALGQGGDLARSLRADEYDEVVAAMERLGFANGWVQEMDSAASYRPDFDRMNPFEP